MNKPKNTNLLGYHVGGDFQGEDSADPSVTTTVIANYREDNSPTKLRSFLPVADKSAQLLPRNLQLDQGK